LKLRAISIEDLDVAAAQAGEGLKIYLSDSTPLPAIAAQMRKSGKGLITLVVPGAVQAQEVEIALPKRQEVTPALKTALQALPGVVNIESV
jgi:DNA polymerase III subunit alpha